VEQYGFVTQSVIAGILATIACGFGAIPLLFRRIDIEKHVGLGYGFAGGLMFAASVYNLLLPALNLGETSIGLYKVTATLAGIFSGSGFIWLLGRLLTPERLTIYNLHAIGTKKEILIFIAMACHSIPEGVAVGVGYGSAGQVAGAAGLGHYIALAIAIHNIPEGLAVSIPMRARGASIARCFFFASLTSLPQPIAAVPASLLVWFFTPLLIPCLGFAAGAMMYLVLVELIPDALEHQSNNQIAWAFMSGFCLLISIQVIL
jgi:zinc transporter, ZIP family